MARARVVKAVKAWAVVHHSVIDHWSLYLDRELCVANEGDGDTIPVIIAPAAHYRVVRKAVRKRPSKSPGGYIGEAMDSIGEQRKATKKRRTTKGGKRG
jgi:hypothetical protein